MGESKFCIPLKLAQSREMTQDLQRMRLHWPHAGFVYVVRNPCWPTGVLKVGRTSRVGGRIGTYNACNPCRIEVCRLFLVRNTQSTEHEMLTRFAAYRFVDPFGSKEKSRIEFVKMSLEQIDIVLEKHLRLAESVVDLQRQMVQVPVYEWWHDEPPPIHHHHDHKETTICPFSSQDKSLDEPISWLHVSNEEVDLLCKSMEEAAKLPLSSHVSVRNKRKKSTPKNNEKHKRLFSLTTTTTTTTRSGGTARKKIPWSLASVGVIDIPRGISFDENLAGWRVQMKNKKRCIRGRVFGFGKSASVADMLCKLDEAKHFLLSSLKK